MELQQQQGQSWTHSGSKRFSAFLPDDEEASSFLPSPPTTPPFSYADRHTLAYTPPSATTSEQLFAFPLGHPSSSSTFARRRAHPISPPLSPQSTADCRPLPSTDSLLFSSPARPRPPPLASAGPSASPASKRISLIKRKPVPQFEEDVELVEDPRWDPTRAAAAASASEEAPLSPGIEAGLRRMSVEDPPSAIARTTQRSVKTLPRLAKGSLPITFMAPLPSPSATDSGEFRRALSSSLRY